MNKTKKPNHGLYFDGWGNVTDTSHPKVIEQIKDDFSGLYDADGNKLCRVRPPLALISTKSEP